jgi:hypothetical protein
MPRAAASSSRSRTGKPSRVDGDRPAWASFSTYCAVPYRRASSAACTRSLFHLGDQAAQLALVGDPFGVAGGLAGGEPGGDGLAGDFAGELVVGSVRAGRVGLAAAAGLAAGGVAADQAAGDGEADLADAGGQGVVAAAQLGQIFAMW